MELHRYLRWRNQNACHPDVLAAQRREHSRNPQRERHPLGRPTQCQVRGFSLTKRTG